MIRPPHAGGGEPLTIAARQSGPWADRDADDLLDQRRWDRAREYGILRRCSKERGELPNQRRRMAEELFAGKNVIRRHGRQLFQSFEPTRCQCAIGGIDTG